MQLESGGHCDVRGKTGEYGCFQFMPGTWRYWSQHVLGYIADQSPVNEYYVAVHKIQYHLNQGHDEGNILLIWNQGNAGACKRGVNASGVAYDSCSYRANGLALLR